jgi:hypothetical protein
LPQDIIPTSIFDIKAQYTLEWKLHWLFRLALCCEFVGHGAFGVLTKQAWVVYFGIFASRRVGPGSSCLWGNAWISSWEY